MRQACNALGGAKDGTRAEAEAVPSSTRGRGLRTDPKRTMHFRGRERKELAKDTFQRVLPKSGGYGRDGARCRSTKDLARLRKTPNGSALSRTNPHAEE